MSSADTSYLGLWILLKEGVRDHKGESKPRDKEQVRHDT